MVRIFLVVGVLSIIFIPIVYYLLVGKSKKTKLSELKQSGKIIDSKITEIRNEVLLRNDVILCRIHAEYKIADINYKFVCGKLYPEDCKHLKVGDTVKILINPHNPQNYYFEYDPIKMEY